MRILICGINYTPELTGIGKYTGEMGAWLAARGHEVHVVTAPPYYPSWKPDPKYPAFLYKREIIDGVNVLRCPLYVPRRASGFRRIMHHLSFALSSAPAILLTALRKKPDVIWVAAPAIAAAPAALLAARWAKTKSWLHILDFEADAAFDLGMIKGEFLRRSVPKIESGILRGFSRVSSISDRMLERVLAKGVDASATALFPNWVDTDGIFPMPEPSPMRRELGIPEDTKVALCAGNMGQKQGLETLIEAARLLVSRKDILFLLCGDGAARPRLEASARDLENVRFLPIQPYDRLNVLLNLADVHLLPQRAEIGDLVMPSRLTGMFASGRPVVAMAAPSTQVAWVVPGKGVVVAPGDARAFSAEIARLLDNPAQCQKLGAAGRAYALENLRKDVLLEAFERELTALAA